jgi:hypothetical protein
MRPRNARDQPCHDVVRGVAEVRPLGAADVGVPSLTITAMAEHAMSHVAAT